MSLLLTGLAALAGGGINALSGLFGAKSQNDNINKYIDILNNSKTSQSDMIGGENNISRFYNASISNVLNRSAINTGGLLNSSVVKAATVAPLAGQSALAQAQYDERAKTRNQSIDRQIAMGELSRPENTVLGDFFSGAVSGGIAGAQISSLLPSSGDVPQPVSTGIDNPVLPNLDPGGGQMSGLAPQSLSMMELPRAPIPDLATPTRTKSSSITLGGGGRVESSLPKGLNLNFPVIGSTLQANGVNNQANVPPPEPIPNGGQYITQSFGQKDHSIKQSSLPKFYGIPSFGGSTVIEQNNPLPQRPYNPLEMLGGVRNIFNFRARSLDWLGSSIWQGLSKERR